MPTMDMIASDRINELEADLEAQTVLNAILEAENIELREEIALMRKMVALERQNRELADFLVA